VTTRAPGIFNDILGPVMRGPSSSHTAGSYHIAVLARALLGASPVRARFTFDPAGSYARVYHQQGADRAFAAGLLGWSLTDPRFFDALEQAAAEGMELTFVVEAMPGADHPNTVDIELASASSAAVSLRARSIGGGASEVTRVGTWDVRLTGETYCVLAEVRAEAETETETELEVRAELEADGAVADDAATDDTARLARDGVCLLVVPRVAPLSAAVLARLRARPDVVSIRETPAIGFAKRGCPLFTSGHQMVSLAEERGWSLGRVALAYEAGLLGLEEAALNQEMLRRFEIMRAAVQAGLSASAPALRLLEPTARKIMDAEAAGRVAIGGLHTRAAARAMAVMHVNGAMGVVCAAPTGGSAGVLPGVVVSLVEDRGLDLESAVRALFAASAIGVIVSFRATFAAEVAGCQVEIGAAGAMAAAAVVEAAGGGPQDAADAAAIAFQNSMGSVCDLVQGMVEIPCHTRNAAAAASAFVCADLVMGGYRNPIGLDETIDAVYDVGRTMPSALRCTSRGGLAVAPSALKLHQRSLIPPVRP
jgi:L-serine dehydratase